MQSFSMTGKVALVTGGSSGIGLETALAFVREGARVAIASRDADRAEAALHKLREAAEAADEVLWIQADVAQSDQVEAMVKRVVEVFGRLDYAVNNGGSGGHSGWLQDFRDEDWDCTIDGYLKSVFLCMKHELRVMLAQGSGSIVNNSSVDGLRAFPWDIAYSAAKHGVIGLTKSAAVQQARSGVRINAVCPGWILTPATQGILDSDPNAEANLLQHQPIGRMGDPAEVAQAIVWLCSERASLLTGVALPVDGGYTAV